MDKYDEMMQRICEYVRSKLKITAIDDVYCDMYNIYITLDCNLIGSFEYMTTPQHLERCIKDSNGCITEIGNDVLYKLEQHIVDTFFKYN